MAKTKTIAGPDQYYVSADGRTYMLVRDAVDADTLEVVSAATVPAGYQAVPSARPASGYMWDGNEWVVDPDYVKPGEWDTDVFIDRFQDDEWAAIWAAIQGSAPLAKWYSKAAANGVIRAESPDTQAGMAALVAAGLLTEQRRDEILDPDWSPE